MLAVTHTNLVRPVKGDEDAPVEIDLEGIASLLRGEKDDGMALGRTIVQ